MTLAPQPPGAPPEFGAPALAYPLNLAPPTAWRPPAPPSLRALCTSRPPPALTRGYPPPTRCRVWQGKKGANKSGGLPEGGEGAEGGDGAEGDGDGDGDGGDEEDEGEEGGGPSHEEIEFDFEKNLYDFCHQPAIIARYVALLPKFTSLPPHVAHAVVKFITRLIKQCKLEPMLFNVST